MLSVGRIVYYIISSHDAEQINRRRQDAGMFVRGISPSVSSGEKGRTGHVLHTGNSVSEGDVYPGVIVRVWNETSVNLHVLLDGNDTFWAMSCTEGTKPGNWSWPVIS